MIEFVPELSKIANIHGSLIMNIDSSNLQPEDWKIIAQKTAEALGKYDGVIISHGTDTLAYTSCALTYMLTFLKKPVVITGSQKPIGEKISDGPKNLKDSFNVASSKVPGVFVVFNGSIIYGDRARKIKTKSFDAFASVNSPTVGQVQSGDIVWNNNVLKNEMARIRKIWSKDYEDKLIPYENENNGDAPPVIVDSSLDPRVFVVKLYPGIEPEVLLFAKDKGYHSVLIEGFGSGGVPFRAPRNLLPVIKELINSKIKVAITTQVPFEGVDLDLYEVGKKVLELGAIPTGDMTPEAALVRLMMKK